MINSKIKIIVNRISYLFSSLIKCIFRLGFTCQFCKSSKYEVIKRKYFITALVRCNNCKLMFRIPTTSYKENKKFYQTKYSGGGQSLRNDKKNLTTNLPSKNELKDLIKTNFANSEKNYKKYIDILKIIKSNKKLKLFDYGCSWGYGSFQIKQSGFEVTSYEVSKSRAEFAQSELGISIANDINSIQQNYFDVFFFGTRPRAFT